MILQGSLAREPHHLQYTQRAIDERLAAEREQTFTRSRKTRFEGECTSSVETTLDGVLEGPLADHLARCETISPFTAQNEPYGFFIHLLSKQLVIQNPVQIEQATLSPVYFAIFPMQLHENRWIQREALIVNWLSKIFNRIRDENWYEWFYGGR